MRLSAPAVGRALRRHAPRAVAALILAQLAQPPVAARSVRFDRLSREDGLSQNQVYSIAQDSEGFMWFGTQEGLNRYDGYSFEVHKADPGDPDSLPSSWVRSLVFAEDGVLWVGTNGGGLTRLDLASWDVHPFLNDPQDPTSLSDNTVRALHVDREGVLWVGTDGGLNRFDPQTETFLRYVNEEDDPSSLQGSSVRAIWQDRDGVLWVGTLGGGLNRFDAETETFTAYRSMEDDPKSLSNDRVRAILEDRQGGLWVGTEGGLNRLDRESGEFTRYYHDPDEPTSLSHNLIFAIFEDGNGTLWIGTDNGLNEYDRRFGNFQRYQASATDWASFGGKRVYSIFQDTGGVIWVGNDEGISKWNPATSASFPHFKQDPSNPMGLNDSYVTAIAQDLRGDLWVGTRTGVNRVDRMRGVTTYYVHDPDDDTSLSNNDVSALLVDHSGDVWVATRRGGLNRFDSDRDRFHRFRHNPQDPTSLGSDEVVHLYEDSKKTLWIGYWNGGLGRYDPSRESFFQITHNPQDADSLSSDRVMAICEDEAGDLWIGTQNGGLNHFLRGSGKFVRYKHEPQNPGGSLSNDTVFAVHPGTGGDVWIGTQYGGLNRLDAARKFHHYTERDGLANNTIYGILEDDDGNLWLSTNSGLSKFNPRIERFRNYDETHGLQAREFDFGAYYRSPRGEMFFGGHSGLNAFFPRQIVENEHVPPVVITDIRVLDRRFNRSAEQIILDYKDYVVTVKFAALDYTAPEKNRYRFKLEGFEDEWREVSGSQEATYTNLPAKTYTFRVQGTNNAGVWNEQGASLKVVVRPAPWKSTGAYAAYIFMGVVLVYSYLRAQARKLEREAEYTHKLEEEVQARTRELGNRNEELQLVNQRLEEASLTDSLTGLRNRRYVMGYMHKETGLHPVFVEQEADESSPEFLFLMIDLDGLKDINDTYGHVAGDRVLIQVRTILESACRESDIISRWGGDEFLVVGRDVHREAGERLAERIRREVENYPFDLGVGGPVELSCSIGLAFYPFVASKPKLVGWEQVVAIADRALYAAKKSGRDAWVGIHGTEKLADTQAGELLKLINERLEVLLQNGRIELVSSFSESRSQLAL